MTFKNMVFIINLFVASVALGTGNSDLYTCSGAMESSDLPGLEGQSGQEFIKFTSNFRKLATYKSVDSEYSWAEGNLGLLTEALLARPNRRGGISSYSDSQIVDWVTTVTSIFMYEKFEFFDSLLADGVGQMAWVEMNVRGRDASILSIIHSSQRFFDNLVTGRLEILGSSLGLLTARPAKFSGDWANFSTSEFPEKNQISYWKVKIAQMVVNKKIGHNFLDSLDLKKIEDILTLKTVLLVLNDFVLNSPNSQDAFEVLTASFLELAFVKLEKEVNDHSLNFRTLELLYLVGANSGTKDLGVQQSVSDFLTPFFVSNPRVSEHLQMGGDVIGEFRSSFPAILEQQRKIAKANGWI